MAFQTAVIDNGYYSTVVYQNKMIPETLHSFRSKVEITNKPDLKLAHTHLLTLKNKHYLIGEGAEQIDISLNKSGSKIHTLTTYAALGLISSIEGNFKLVANCPLNLYNRTNKEELENYLKSKQKTNFTLNGKYKTISITDCLVFPQTLPVIYVNSVPSNIVGILDIGGLTAQGCIAKNKNLVPSSLFTESLGTLILYNKVKKALNSKYNINIADYEIEEVIKNGILHDKERSLAIIEDLINEHIDLIIKAMKLVNWNIENTIILLTGGGCLLLEPYLRKKFPNYQVSQDPVNDNVKGLWEVAKYYYEN